MHGSTHFWFKHASCNPHSADTTHSGRQFGGEPIIFVWQAHTAAPFDTRQFEFWPPVISWQFEIIRNWYYKFFFVVRTYMDLDCINPVALGQVLVCMKQKDPLCSLEGTHNLVYGLRQHRLPVVHKCWRTGQRICCSNMLLMGYIQCSLYILDGSRCMDPQSNHWHTYKLRCRKLHCLRMGLDHMDCTVLVEAFQLFLCIAWTDHQCNEVSMCIWVCGFECDILK